MKRKAKYIIVGTGFRTNNKDLSSLENIFNSKDIKINIGTAAALELTKSGNDIVLLSKTQKKLDAIKRSLEIYNLKNEIITYSLDILNQTQVNSFVNSLDKTCDYHLVHCVGLSSGTYDVENNNPYLSIENTNINLIKEEFDSVMISLFNLVKSLLPIFRKQEQTRVVVVSSMSSVRSFPFGFSHTAAKGALHQAVVSLRLELNKENILISEVMPGIVDTGYYDTDATKDAVKKISQHFGYDYKELPMMPAKSVAEVINMCLFSEAHILQVNLVSQGQFPNMSA